MRSPIRARLVAVRGPDAALRRAEGVLAEEPLGHLLELEVVRHDHVRVAATAGGRETSMPAPRARRSPSSSTAGSTTTPSAITERDVGVEDARGDQLELQQPPLGDDRVAGVVAALIPDDEVHPVREVVDRLALALIPPLGPEHDGGRHDAQSTERGLPHPSDPPYTRPVHIDWGIVLAGAIVGFIVGMTGMGGGALMTPILVIFFRINPTAAVSSRPGRRDGDEADRRRGAHPPHDTVRWPLVRWLCIGSIPMAFAGVFIVHNVGDSEQVENLTKLFLGWTLLLAASAMVVQGLAPGARARSRRGWPAATRATACRRSRCGSLPTVIVGLVGGLLVGLTSVGSGSIIIICLMLLYPVLRGAELVGTDLVQAIPLVAAAALAHILVGDFELDLTASILIGSIPAVWFGARMSSKAPDGVIRPLLVFVLAASALKLLDVPTQPAGRAVAAVRTHRVRRLGRDRRGAAPEDAVGSDRARQEELGAAAALPRAGRGRRGVCGGVLHEDPPAARGRRRTTRRPPSRQAVIT